MHKRVFGIRHHGPGSARCLLEALQDFQPDLILIEGPEEANDIVRLAAEETMEPPVALLTYAKDNPQRASFFPFAVFSPEWQAIQYGLSNDVKIQFMDLPQSYVLAFPEEEETARPTIESDPLSALAKAAGYDDGERWWNQLVEERRAGDDIFPAVAEAMTALRESYTAPPKDVDNSAEAVAPARRELREAYMRKTIRKNAKSGCERMAIVCGAYHVPALLKMPKVKHDNQLLKGLKKTKVEVTWTPWTYSRLCWSSGYGAGIRSPGWYHHLWEAENSVAERWLTTVAHLLREAGLDASSAHVIEAVRLAETLAALRGRSIAGLDELEEAVQAVMCFGSETPLALIKERLIVSNRLGRVPKETPQTPLQKDFHKSVKKVRLKLSTGIKDLDLDLRKPIHMQRSLLFHRLLLLQIAWGTKGSVSSSKKGSFHEVWQIEWDPTFEINLVEGGVWGTTVEDAASARAINDAIVAERLADVTNILELTSLAALPKAVAGVVNVLQEKSALSADVTHLMDALPQLVGVIKYGSVRNTDTELITHIVDGMVARIFIALPGACSSLNDDAATDMLAKISMVDRALFQLEKDKHLEQWRETLSQLVRDDSGVHSLLRGRGMRLLFDSGYLDRKAVENAMFRALSQANEPDKAASWLEGFLSGSGTVLLYDDRLLKMLDQWVSEMSDEHFTAVLPLLRRTTSTFEFGERRKLGEKVKTLSTVSTGTSMQVSSGEERMINRERAKKVLPTLLTILGIKGGDKNE